MIVGCLSCFGTIVMEIVLFMVKAYKSDEIYLKKKRIVKRREDRVYNRMPEERNEGIPTGLFEKEKARDDGVVVGEEVGGGDGAKQKGGLAVQWP